MPLYHVYSKKKWFFTFLITEIKLKKLCFLFYISKRSTWNCFNSRLTVGVSDQRVPGLFALGPFALKVGPFTLIIIYMKVIENK